jgi:hypothetical protein
VAHAALKHALETVISKAAKRGVVIDAAKWTPVVGALPNVYDVAKMARDFLVWKWQTLGGDPVIAFEAYRTGSGMAIRSTTTGGSGGLVRPEGADVSFSLSESGGNDSYNFTLKNVEGAALWEWRVGLDGDQPEPTDVSAPPGWKWDIVWNMDERCVRWWTEGANGWAAGDFGDSVINQGASLSGFSFTIPYRLQQCYFTATGTDLRMDGGMLSMVPNLSAAPPDFAPTEGETTKLQAYLDRPATASIKIFSGGLEYVTGAATESRPAGDFAVTWDGKGPDARRLFGRRHLRSLHAADHCYRSGR